MGAPSGFEFAVRGEDVVIRHHGITASVLRGARAQEFLAQAATGDAQQLMARVTGNYRRGNERTARRHLRNQA
ncbi:MULTISPECIES: hypothetical protein [Microbacterium]|nr:MULTISPECIES: hypothetical protein [Microbacterium]KKX96594.1 hypothetical protein AAY78_18585 [Microbacterium sp. Ag1]